ncbi:calcium-dependent phosphotriesterase superfamily protein [Striga asiatica]|uniref:Calcium-dependent phosphotriesterase superfamily protein n=1 Tax=Striga asiatica TaxID=4170 RepID=A0A5A7P8P8_STRAF|nr:calcium-dependent phosphotriesterase superfamily protein [Striga asiatica]
MAFDVWEDEIHIFKPHKTIQEIARSLMGSVLSDASGIGKVGSSQEIITKNPDKGIITLRSEGQEEALGSENSEGKDKEDKSVGERGVVENDNNESQLMDITVQTDIIEGRALQRRKKAFVRKPRTQGKVGKVSAESEDKNGIEIDKRETESLKRNFDSLVGLEQEDNEKWDCNFLAKMAIQGDL